jgi:hypothetical protein
MEIVSVTPAGRFDGFDMPMTTFEDMAVEYYAYDFDGNVAICQVKRSPHNGIKKVSLKKICTYIFVYTFR